MVEFSGTPVLPQRIGKQCKKLPFWSTACSPGKQTKPVCSDRPYGKQNNVYYHNNGDGRANSATRLQTSVVDFLALREYLHRDSAQDSPASDEKGHEENTRSGMA